MARRKSAVLSDRVEIVAAGDLTQAVQAWMLIEDGYTFNAGLESTQFKRCHLLCVGSTWF